MYLYGFNLHVHSYHVGHTMYCNVLVLILYFDLGINIKLTCMVNNGKQVIIVKV